MIYSEKLVLALAYIFMKLKGAIALYRIRAILPGIGRKSRVHISVEIKHANNIKIGDHVAIGPAVTLGGYGGIEIDDYVRISKGASIESASLDLGTELPYKHIARPIHIKEGAWLGSRCIILGGVTVGKKAVIGAGAIVTKDVPDGAVVVAQPLRIIR
jgi:maltose O-acetyltransferase